MTDGRVPIDALEAASLKIYRWPDEILIEAALLYLPPGTDIDWPARCRRAIECPLDWQVEEASADPKRWERWLYARYSPIEIAWHAMAAAPLLNDLRYSSWMDRLQRVSRDAYKKMKDHQARGGVEIIDLPQPAGEDE